MLNKLADKIVMVSAAIVMACCAALMLGVTVTILFKMLG